MPAYLIGKVEIIDWPQYLEYMKVTPGIIAEFGGRFIARGGETITLEGPPESSRIVVIEFPSLTAATSFYHSEQYQKARLLREDAAAAHFVVVDGLPAAVARPPV